MKGVTPHAAVLVCKKATARSISSFIAAGIAQHIASLREAWIELISKLLSGTEGPFAMVGPQETDEQQRVSQQGLLVAFEADEEASAGLLAPANRSHFDHAMEFSTRAGMSPRDARIVVAAYGHLDSSDNGEAGPARAGGARTFKTFAARTKVCALSFSVFGILFAAQAR